MSWRDIRSVHRRLDESHAVLSVCLGSYFAVRFAQVVVGPVIPSILTAFDVSRGAVGTALSGMWVAYALSQFPSGVLADRFGERKMLLSAIGTAATAAVGIALAPTFLAFGAGMIALGVGSGLYYNPATSLLAREFDAVGGVVGIHRIGGQMAGVVAPLVAAPVAVRYGWRIPVALGAVFAVAAALLVFGRIESVSTERPMVSLRETVGPEIIATVLTRSHARNSVLMASMVEFVGLTAMTFLPVFLIERHGLSKEWAMILLAVFFAVTAVSQPLAGRLSDRVGRDETIALLAPVGCLGYGALAVCEWDLLVGPSVVLAGMATSSTSVVQTRMLDGLSDDNRGTGFGVFRTLYLLLGAAGTFVVGTVADAAGWTVAFGLLATLFVAVLGTVAAAGFDEGTMSDR